MPWMRTSWSPARARMDDHDPSMSVMCVPGFAPGTTQGLPGWRGTSCSTRTADGDRWTVRAPVFPSQSLSAMSGGRRYRVRRRFRRRRALAAWEVPYCTVCCGVNPRNQDQTLENKGIYIRK